VSVASANGFTGTVATSTSTPAITITTSITGVLKGNGTAISAATSGTDYAPGTSALATGIVKSTTTTGALSIAVAGTDYQAPVSATGLLKSSGVSGNVTAATANVDYQSAQSVTGIVKSSGTTRSAASAGVDYQAPITLTTTGSSGAATFSNNTLNIPQYSGGASSFSALSDASSSSLTVDKIYLPAITRLDVTNNGATAYRFDQYDVADDPTIYAISGTTIAFNLNVTGHPFLIQTSGGANYSTGLVHVSTTGTVSTGVSAQGQVTGTLYWKIPAGTTGNYRYICSIHGSMVGVITIKDISTI
jgi:plastocyanin